MTGNIHILFLSLLLSVVNLKSISQNYLSLFGENSTTWDILYGVCDAQCSETFFIEGDTTVGGITYKFFAGLPYFIREDTVQGKAWCYNTSYDTEYLFMDLSLNLGDSFHIYNESDNPIPFVVDSVYYVSNRKHVRLNAKTSLCGLDEKITFIEGSGTTAGISYQRYLYNDEYVFSYMLCQHKDGVRVAGNNLFMDTCYVCEVGVNEVYSDLFSFNVLPNPTFHDLIIHVESSTDQNLYLIIYDLLGKLIVSQPVNSKFLRLDVSAFQSGVYIVEVKSKFVTKRRKFIKE